MAEGNTCIYTLRVKDTSDRPISGVYVTAGFEGFDRYTDSNGYASFTLPREMVEMGNYNYIDFTVFGAVDGVEFRKTVRVEDGIVATVVLDGDIRYYHSITSVCDNSHVVYNVPNANVKIYQSQDSISPIKQTYTNSNGEYIHIVETDKQYNTWFYIENSDFVGGNTIRNIVLKKSSGVNISLKDNYYLEIPAGNTGIVDISQNSSFYDHTYAPQTVGTGLVLSNQSNMGTGAPSDSSRPWINNNFVYSFASGSSNVRSFVRSSQHRVFAIHNGSDSNIRYRVACLGSGSDDLNNLPMYITYGISTANADNWCELESKNGRRYYSFTQTTSNNSLTKKAIGNLTPGNKYEFRFHTFCDGDEDNACDGIIISQNGNLTYGSTDLETSGFARCWGVNSGTVTYTLPSDNSEVYLYYYKNGSIVGPNRIGYGYADVEVIDNSFQSSTTISPISYNKIYAESSKTGYRESGRKEIEGAISLYYARTYKSNWLYLYEDEFKVKVIDEKTDSVVKGATVTYKNGDTVLGTVTTDNTGTAMFNYGENQQLTVTVSRSNYNDKVETIYSNQTNEVILSPKNSIRILENGSRQPASGKTVKIYKIDSNNRPIVYGTYVTHNNGYIDTLENDIYNLSTNAKLTVTNYNTLLVEDLTIDIVPGDIEFELPEEFDIYSDLNNEYDTFNEESVYSIKKHISAGNTQIMKVQTPRVNYNSDDFMINIIDPDSVNVYDIFTCTPVMMNYDQKEIIGTVDTCLKPDLNDLRIKVINRYSGYYNPIFKDVLFYNNIEDCPYSNVSFDDDYEDNQGKFGVIKNMWFHKVNDDNKEIIKTLTPNYPLIGQYAIDKRDYNIFETNWDTKHYTRQLDVEESERCGNISSMKDGLCMFGSKYLNVPEQIIISGFEMGNDENWNGEWDDDYITSPYACPGEFMYKEVNNNSVDFYLFIKKRILRYFREILLKIENGVYVGEFGKYIGEGYSFGEEGLEDDVNEYVTKNILKLYKLEKVRLFVKRTKKNKHNSKIENDYTSAMSNEDQSDFIKNGFVEIKNMTMTKINRDDFDRKIVYNLRSGYKEEIGFSFILKKI